MKLVKLISAFLLLSLLVSCTTNDDEEQNTANIQRAAKINVQLALNYMQENNLVRAKQKLMLANKQAPDSALVNGAMAYYSERTGDNKRAETYYKQAIDVADVKGGPENNYGTFLCRQGHYEQAEKYFNEAATDPEYLNTGKAYVNAGLCALLVPKPDVAKQYFEKALQQNPDSSSALLELAKLEFDQADYKQANTYLQTYMKKVTTPNAEALWLAIRVAQRAGDINSVKTYGSLLRADFPNSKQYQQFQQLQASLT
tara:strand:+ start:18905 stop:19675 length:771 start_codon:yes stop_codon:yes gene_type:complete